MSPRPTWGFARQLNVGDDLAEDHEYLVEQRERFANDAGADGIPPSTKTVDGHDPEAAPGQVSVVGAPVLDRASPTALDNRRRAGAG